LKRRDILKQAGALALGLPAMNAAGLITSVVSSPTRKDLIVRFTGPFCYWLENGVKVMAPPVGTNFRRAQHQAWTATSANETTLNSVSGSNPPNYELKIGLTATSPILPIPAGTKIFNYEQGTPPGKNPLFNLTLPFPDKLIGTRPTRVTIIPQPGRTANAPQILAAGLTFYYKDVDLDQVRLTDGDKTVFTPCFTNDAELPCANLGIFLTRVNQRPDHSHNHAKQAWSQMLDMYPWMKKEIKDIDFPPFNPAACFPPEAGSVPPNKTSSEDIPHAMVGPGDDCEVPIMLLRPPLQTQPTKK
jgi:hypothetical protein